ncbi:MAG: glycosyltransferase [Candidatus Cloacimonetes bacterium]|nr:glycosyltransferase [Candidatus Cloacimonadota bacterium]
MSFLPSVSIIVPVRNSEDNIGYCLQSLIDLDYPDYEIIVVDNNSTDNTRQIIVDYPAAVLSEKNIGAYLARNKGIAAARGEIIAFTDADCRVDRNWLQMLVRHYRSKDVGGVGGNLLPFSPSNLIEEFLSLGKLRIYHSSRISSIGTQGKHFLSHGLGSANMSFRKSVLTMVKNFNPHLADFGGDYDLTWRVQRAGYNIIYDPEAIVYHRMRNSIYSMLSQFHAFGKELPHLLVEQPGNYSYLQIKTYLLPLLEYRCHLPFRAMITLDFLTLASLLLIMTLLLPSLIPYTVVIFSVVLAGSIYMTIKALKRSKKIIWIILFPLLHLLRNCAFSIGKIRGGFKYKVLVL